mmetsp:Transcript_85255/g.204244  ORF Transcript_85255/g.204244 Transcript_85255/m.204244 type:complete len:479 (-) Transcript_85255:462-1898(-)
MRQHLAQGFEELLLGDAGGPIRLEVGAEDPEHFRAQRAVIPHHDVRDVAKQQQQKAQEVGLGRVPPATGQDVDGKAWRFFSHLLVQLLHHGLEKWPAKHLIPFTQPLLQDTLQEVEGLLPAEALVPHLVRVPQRHRSGGLHVSRQPLVLVLEALAAPLEPSRSLAEGIPAHQHRLVLVLTLGRLLPVSMSHFGHQRRSERVLGELPEERGLQRRALQPIGRQQGPGSCGDAHHQILQQVTLLHGARALRVQKASAVSPHGPRRQWPDLNTGVVATDLLVGIHNVLVILLLCGIHLLEFDAALPRQPRLLLRRLVLLPWHHVGVLQALRVQLSLDHLVPLVLVFNLMLQLRELCVVLALLLPQRLHLLLHAFQVAEDVHVLLVRLLSQPSVPVGAGLHLIELGLHARLLLSEHVPSVLALVQAIAQAFHLLLEPQSGLPDEVDALHLDRLEPALGIELVPQLLLELLYEVIHLALVGVE